MGTSSNARVARTYLPAEDNLGEVHDLLDALRRRGIEPPERRAALVDAEGRRFELPDSLVEVLIQAADAISHGLGVTIAPYAAMLTTQEAADFLGISRPTLVKLAETGEIPFELRGRHRRVRLNDLVAYQERMRTDRSKALRRMATEGEAAGIYDLAPDPAPRTR